jgi:hypothetical protein
MKLKPLNKDIKVVLDRIQNSIPKEWLDNVTRKEMLAPKYAKLIRDMASGTANKDVKKNFVITPEMKEKAQALIDSGQINELEKEVDVENKEITDKIDKFVDEEIQKAIKRGELPKGKKHRNIGKKFKRIIKTKNGTSKK